MLEFYARLAHCTASRGSDPDCVRGSVEGEAKEALARVLSSGAQMLSDTPYTVLVPEIAAALRDGIEEGSVLLINSVREASNWSRRRVEVHGGNGDPVCACPPQHYALLSCAGSSSRTVGALFETERAALSRGALARQYTAHQYLLGRLLGAHVHSVNAWEPSPGGFEHDVRELLRTKKSV